MGREKGWERYGVLLGFYDDVHDLYDWDYNNHDDVWVYSKLIEEMADPEPVLEPCCGTGRLTFEIGRDHRIIGLDNHAAMLQHALENLQKHRHRRKIRATLVLGDLLHLPFPPSMFGFVFISVNSFLHLLTGNLRRQAMNEMSRVLRSGGRICLHCELPDDDLLEEPTELYNDYSHQRRSRIRRTMWMDLDPVTQVRSMHNSYFEQFDDGRSRELRTTFRLLFTDRAEMEELALGAGLTLVKVLDIFGEPYEEGDENMVFVLEKKN